MATALDQRSARPYPGSAGISAVLDVLDALDRHGPVTLAQLSRETGVAKSTLHRVCSTMGKRGWIARDSSSGNIELGPRVAWLARANPASALTAGFYEVARKIVERHNETTCLTVLDGCESVFVAKQETTHPVRLVTAVGSRLPAFASASGRAMLADLAEREVAAMYKGSELVTPTGRRLQGISELMTILRETRRRGYAENVDETALGLRCLAVPVGPPGRVAGAITLCVPSGRIDGARKRAMLPDLIAAARALAGPWALAAAEGEISVSRLNNLRLSPDTTVAAARADGRDGPDHERKGAQ
ncbi:MAG TPA: IclR family transcriptional regulator [Solirubrobacteraceae bacterium]|nr:IclR family transcriptional regulator [Kofleriaceae bacterium]HEX4672616.1 IclR family transcriptional regulator [Solirubrobacteraceae bacterium]